MGEELNLFSQRQYRNLFTRIACYLGIGPNEDSTKVLNKVGNWVTVAAPTIATTVKKLTVNTYTVDLATDYTVVCPLANTVITMPAVIASKYVNIKNESTTAVTVNGPCFDDGAYTSVIIMPGDSVAFNSNATCYFAI